MKTEKSIKNGTTHAVVVDIGTIFLKYSLFSSVNGMNDYLIKSEIKYMKEMYTDGYINYNLFKRDLRRKIDEFRKLGEIDILIIIPQRNANEGTCIPRFEYREKAKEFKSSVKTSYKPNDLNVSVYDWILLDDQPEHDYQSVLIDSVPEDMILNLNEVAVSMGVKEFLITSPLLSYLNIFPHDDKAHAIIDAGHSRTRVTIIKNGVIYLYKDRAKSGSDITEAIASNHNSQYEAMIYKHNSDFGSLPNDVDAIIEEMKDVLKISCEEYANLYNDVVSDYCIIGGTANLEIEEDINQQTVGINRVYPKLNIDNDNQLFMESRNYLYGSYSTFQYYIENQGDKERTIDFSASKSGGIGLKVKALVHTYGKYKVPLVSALAGMYLLAGSLAFFSYNIDEYGKEIENLRSNYEASLAETTASHTSVYDSYKSLNAETLNQKGSNTGMLLERIRKISPASINIKSLKLVGDGNKGILILKSDSQTSISAFLTLLQDPIDGAFKKASLADIKLKESMGRQFYETTINLEGRNI